MTRWILLVLILLLAFLIVTMLGVPRQLRASEEVWRFAVSGDSRNCGDVVMPAIDKGVLEHNVEFYWHLGDFRVGYDIDEDMRDQYGDSLTAADYPKDAWGDFLSKQIAPLGKLPVYLGIGNHELYLKGNGKEDQSHDNYIAFFHSWLDTPVLRKQRLSDDPSATAPNAYYHWKRRPVDFIYLDNSKDEGFGSEQLAWLAKVLGNDRSDQGVFSVVVGMHRALPNSLACGHSMNGDPSTPADVNLRSLKSGRTAYGYLLDFHKATGKRVYVLASHSHFFMEDIFDTAYWKNTRVEGRGVLEGWLIGAAGAKRYRLPDDLPPGTRAIPYVYGYLLGTVSPSGKVSFEFEKVTESEVPQDIRARYSKKLMSFCFAENKDDSVHVSEKSCQEQ